MHKRLLDEFPPAMVESVKDARAAAASKTPEEIVKDVRDLVYQGYIDAGHHLRELSDADRQLLEAGEESAITSPKVQQAHASGQHASPEELQARIKQMKQQFGQTLGEALTKQSMVGLGALAPKSKEFTIFDIVSNMSKKATLKATRKQQKKAGKKK